jgi:hypothetical protein
MGHIKVSATRAENTPAEWLGVGKTIGELVNVWSERHDIIAYVGEGAGGPAPACYNPALAEVEVNTDVAFGKATTPEMVGDLSQRSQQYEFPKATGAIMHEAFHAKFSTFDMESAYKTLAKDEYEALMLLEEGRIETQGVWLNPLSKNFLRACAIEIVLADAKESFAEATSTVASSAQGVGLIYARVDAGILDATDVKGITDVIDTHLGEQLVSKLRGISKTFRESVISYQKEAESVLYPLAKEWAKLIRDAKEEKGEQDSASASEMMQALMDALEEASENTAISVGDALAEQELDEANKEMAKQKSNAAKEQNENKETASKVFSKSSGEGGGGTNSRLIEKRNPTSKERVAAVQIAKMLERAKYRERDLTEISSVTPPGRLRTRQIIQGKALKERGVNKPVEAWRRNVRKHTDDPTLTVGVMVDISGSMGDAMQPMATTAWVMSEAVRRVQGKTAMVYFGQDVFPTLKAGQHLPEVQVYTAQDSTEEFDKAFRALDGSLNLLHGKGARLLVVVSDGHYRSDQREMARQWTRKCGEAGVAVLWLPFDNGHSASRILNERDGVIMSGVLDPVSASIEIGKASERVLTAVGSR